MSEHKSGRPVVKTLLLTDFVESTQFVSALGDLRAAEIFAAHDHAARELLGEHGGQEIDKSDGFLFLFDRPIDAVRFSLVYHRLLSELSADLPRPLEARSGIHLGEVVMRSNPSDDVERGAKPVEVEGLAKSKTARVMACACGNQTLLSESAYRIGYRAAVGADGLDESVRWVEHGLYPLKGIDEPVRLFEVGREGESHLAPPPGAMKQKRSSALLPLMLILLVVGTFGAFFWSTLQSPPPTPTIAQSAAYAPASPSPLEASTPDGPLEARELAAPPLEVEADVAASKDPDPSTPVRAAELVELEILSDPPGAEILYGAEGEDVVGRAPVSLNVPAALGAYPIRARLDGHREGQSLCRVDAADLKALRSRCTLKLKTKRRPKTKRGSASETPLKAGAAKAKSKPSKSKPKIHMID